MKARYRDSSTVDGEDPLRGVALLREDDVQGQRCRLGTHDGNAPRHRRGAREVIDDADTRPSSTVPLPVTRASAAASTCKVFRVRLHRAACF